MGVQQPLVSAVVSTLRRRTHMPRLEHPLLPMSVRTSSRRCNARAVDVSGAETEIVEPDACDLLLMVSNQSYLDDPVTLTVVIDGFRVLSQPFEVRNQHHFVRFPLRLAPGTHELTAVSNTG